MDTAWILWGWFLTFMLFVGFVTIGLAMIAPYAPFIKAFVRKYIGGRSDISLAGSLYMRRWRLGPDWLPGLRVHQIVRSDDDRALHDHPFDFITFILKGGYWEHLADGSRTFHGPGTVLFRRAEMLHRLELNRTWRVIGLCESDDEVPAWTFVIRGPHRREWGFDTLKGWVHNRLFITKRENGNHSDVGGQK